MSKDKEIKPDLKLSDFGFLHAGKLRKLELRFNSNTSEKLHLQAYFVIEHDREDTQVGVILTGKDFPECMEKLHDWHNGYYTHIKVFGKLAGREKEEDKGKAMPF